MKYLISTNTNVARRHYAVTGQSYFVVLPRIKNRWLRKLLFLSTMQRADFIHDLHLYVFDDDLSHYSSYYRHINTGQWVLIKYHVVPNTPMDNIQEVLDYEIVHGFKWLTDEEMKLINLPEILL